MKSGSSSDNALGRKLLVPSAHSRAGGTNRETVQVPSAHNRAGGTNTVDAFTRGHKRPSFRRPKPPPAGLAKSVLLHAKVLRKQRRSADSRGSSGHMCSNDIWESLLEHDRGTTQTIRTLGKRRRRTEKRAQRKRRIWENSSEEQCRQRFAELIAQPKRKACGVPAARGGKHAKSKA